MAAEEALEEWIFDQNLFKESADSIEEAAEEPAKPRPARESRKRSRTPLRKTAWATNPNVQTIPASAANEGHK